MNGDIVMGNIYMQKKDGVLPMDFEIKNKNSNFCKQN